MYPLRFPHRLLKAHAKPGNLVLDPFCGRGTTNYAARLLGLDSVGIDSSPVAVAVAQAKTVAVTPADVMAAYDRMAKKDSGAALPTGEFWHWCFHPRVLAQLVSLRAAFLHECRDPADIALRAILLGALHGPRNKGRPSHFSNQAPRTYAPKPRYAAGYWQQQGLVPQEVNLRDVIRVRAQRFFGQEASLPRGQIFLSDSRSLSKTHVRRPVDWVVCSPPYYGLRTYVPDQWLRYWFLGGPPSPSYSMEGQLEHGSPEAFALDLRTVWLSAARVAVVGARMCVRFGGISNRKADPRAVLLDSLQGSGWKIQTARPAGNALAGKRQAQHFRAGEAEPKEEWDYWAIRV